MNPLGVLIEPYIDPEDTILDIGCGIMTPLDGISCKSILGVDLYLPYLDAIKDRYSTIQMDVKDLNVFPNDSYDVVVALDLVEHLVHAPAMYVLQEMKRICRKHAIVFTPKSFHTNEENVENVWDMGENPLQRHKCLVTKQELAESGYVRVKTASYPDMILAVYSSSSSSSA